MRYVRVTDDAERDLDDIWLYVARDSIDAANRLVDGLTARFALIASTPEMGRARDELKVGVRSHPVDNCVIYYRNHVSNVEILHLVHGARDSKRVFRS